MGFGAMQDDLRELTSSELDAVAGGFNNLNIVTIVRDNGNNNGNGNGNGDGNGFRNIDSGNMNGNGNGNGDTVIEIAV